MDAENTVNPSTGENDELDDVEAHGFKEVALGLGAAAVIGGGGAGVALAASGAAAPAPASAGHVVHTLVTNTDDALSRHTPQGPPTASTDQTAAPAAQVTLPKPLHPRPLVPVAGTDSSPDQTTATVAKVVHAAANTFDHATTGVEKTVQQPLDGLAEQAPPPQR